MINCRLRLFSVLTLAPLVSHPAFAADAKPADPAVAPPAETVTMIADLRGKPPDIFSSQSWQGNLAVNESGLLVLGSKGADGKGEMGQNLSAPINLAKAEYIEVALAVANKNEVPEITIAFSDVDGIQFSARVRIDQVMPQQPVWFRVRRADFQLNDWEHKTPNRKINWSRISQWHLQGDWQTTAPFRVLFIALRAR